MWLAHQIYQRHDDGHGQEGRNSPNTDKNPLGLTRVIISVVLIVVALLICAVFVWRKRFRHRRSRDNLGPVPAADEMTLDPNREIHILGRNLKKSSRGVDEWRGPPAEGTEQNYKEIKSSVGPGTFTIMTRRLDAIEEAISPASEKKDQYGTDMRELAGQDGGYGWGYGKRDETARLQRERSEEELPTEPAPAYSRHP